MKPILFNTEMTRAILDGRKTVTRRVLKNPNIDLINSGWELNKYGVYCSPSGAVMVSHKPRPYQPGDILYVRETWMETTHGYWYKATDEKEERIRGYKWCSSIHMPREAARIFLKVTNVRVERLQDITEEQAIKEGCDGDPFHVGIMATPIHNFANIWSWALKLADRDCYCWKANPFCWVIEFERCEKEVEE